MKYITTFLTPFIILLAACDSGQQSPYKAVTKPTIEKSDAVIDLNESTNNIVRLLKEEKLSEILSPEAKNVPETIASLIKNFSPAHMAFESEVLNFEGPIILLFYDEDDPINRKVVHGFKRMAQANSGKAKFVIIEVSKLFSIAEQGNITQVPTFVLINHRKELGRIENPQLEIIDTELNNLIMTLNKS